MLPSLERTAVGNNNTLRCPGTARSDNGEIEDRRYPSGVTSNSPQDIVGVLSTSPHFGKLLAPLFPILTTKE